MKQFDKFFVSIIILVSCMVSLSILNSGLVLTTNLHTNLNKVQHILHVDENTRLNSTHYVKFSSNVKVQTEFVVKLMYQDALDNAHKSLSKTKSQVEHFVMLDQFHHSKFSYLSNRDLKFFLNRIDLNTNSQLFKILENEHFKHREIMIGLKYANQLVHEWQNGH